MVEESPKAYVGRPQVAKKLVEYGYADSVEGAMDEYIGDVGKRRAWFENPHKKQILSLRELMDVVHEEKGVAILAHLYYYKIEETEQQELLNAFSEMAGLVDKLQKGIGRNSLDAFFVICGPRHSRNW